MPRGSYRIRAIADSGDADVSGLKRNDRVPAVGPRAHGRRRRRRPRPPPLTRYFSSSSGTT